MPKNFQKLVFEKISSSKASTHNYIEKEYVPVSYAIYLSFIYIKWILLKIFSGKQQFVLCYPFFVKLAFVCTAVSNSKPAAL